MVCVFKETDLGTCLHAWQGHCDADAPPPHPTPLPHRALHQESEVQSFPTGPGGVGAGQVGGASPGPPTQNASHAPLFWGQPQRFHISDGSPGAVGAGGPVSGGECIPEGWGLPSSWAAVSTRVPVLTPWPTYDRCLVLLLFIPGRICLFGVFVFCLLKKECEYR